MDQLTRYRQVVREVLDGYAAVYRADPGVTTEVVHDPARDHFELIRVGWDGRRRVHYVVHHIDLIDGKVWVQHDATDRPVADELVRAGVPKSDIVLAFQPADVRPHTEFAVG